MMSSLSACPSYTSAPWCAVASVMLSGFMVRLGNRPEATSLILVSGNSPIQDYPKFVGRYSRYKPAAGWGHA